MQLAFSDGSHIVHNPTQYAAAHRRLGGVGNLDPQSQQIAGIAATGVTTAAGILVGLSVIGGPVGAAIAGLASIGIAIANMFGGCGQTCVAATHIADQVGALLQQMFNTYMASPIHYESMQRAYLIQWDAAWNALVHACSDPALGDAGQRCITDRQSGACHYQTPAGGWVKDASGNWVFDGSAGPNCWNWFTGSRDPVANDPTVVPDPIGAIVDPATGEVTGIEPPSIFGAGGASLGPLVLIGGGIAAALLILGSD